MLNKLVSVVLFIHCVLLLILGNVKDTVSDVGVYNIKIMCLTFVSLLYMMVVVCKKPLTSVGGVPTALLFGLSFICVGVKLLINEPSGEQGIITQENDQGKPNGLAVIGGIASVVSILLGVVLTFSICKK
jgi:hypothetical protein